ncbi:MAG: C40 family peptidase [Gammaproteobacteria bacterium]|nr:C40 family peptidase [Gammaproteobacteria bacterium]MDH3767384.1 C40 family peptidase [Gammaproteobacteria bacterium]
MLRCTALVILIAGLGVVAGCATSLPTVDRSSSTRERSVTSETGALIARAALDVLGTPYRYGGSDKNGFDCSGLVQYAHSRAGIRLPRTTSTQFSAAKNHPVNMEVGDVLFYRIGGRVSHNGIYLGNGRFIHAPSTGKNVSIIRTDNPYFRDKLAGIRRFH